MRFTCQVQVFNYKLCASTSAIQPQPKPRRSTLTLGGYGGSERGGKLWILHQNAQNGPGVRYKVNSNIVTLHVKFLHEGKMTIRLREPTVDLRISGQAAEVTKFARLIRDILSGKPLPPTGLMKISNLETASKMMEPPPKKFLAIVEKKDLKHIKNGYPTSLNELSLSSLDLVCVDPKIFRLPHLKILRLECNQIKMIPKSIELLSGLTHLHLKGNLLGLSTDERDWEWLRSKSLQSSLVVLDLSSNQLRSLPNSLAHLRSLTGLKVDDNLLVALPNNLGFARKLRTLSIKKNLLRWIPASLLFSKIDAIDVSENHLGVMVGNANQVIYTNDADVPSLALKDLAARAVLLHSLQYNETSLPRELIRYLEGANYCLCGKATFPSWPSSFVSVPANSFCDCVTYDMQSTVVLGYRTCANKFAKCSVKLKALIC